MNNGVLIASSIFVLVILASFLAFSFSDLHRKRRNVRERIRKEASAEQSEQNEGFSKGERLKDILLRTITRFGESLKPTSEAASSGIRKKLLKAGYHGERHLVVFFGSKAIMAVLLLAMFILVKFIALKPMPARQVFTLMALSAAAGFLLPDYFLYRRTKNRKRKIFEGFPDALDLMVVCVEAGMGLDAAFKRVGAEMALKNKVLSDELGILSLELRAGKPRVDALRNLAMRTDLEDVSSLTTLLIQTDRFGTRVAQALRVHSDAMRTKRYQRADEIAAKLPVKLLFPLVFFILPAMLVALLGPAAIQFYRILMKGNFQW